jgi:prepilin-type N-terminal cleavage/methylation domain-containing protein
MSRKGFTLVELLIVLVIISSLLGLSITGFKRFASSLGYKNAIDQVVTDIKYTQQMADSTQETCRIEFKAGSNDYSIYKSGTVIRAAKIDRTFQFYGKSYFSFVANGYTDVGGSGTLFIGGSSKVKKIIVSSRGRIRVE